MYVAPSSIGPVSGSTIALLMAGFLHCRFERSDVIRAKVIVIFGWVELAGHKVVVKPLRSPYLLLLVWKVAYPHLTCLVFLHTNWVK